MRPLCKHFTPCLCVFQVLSKRFSPSIWRWCWNCKSTFWYYGLSILQYNRFVQASFLFRPCKSGICSYILGPLCKNFLFIAQSLIERIVKLPFDIYSLSILQYNRILVFHFIGILKHTTITMFQTLARTHCINIFCSIKSNSLHCGIKSHTCMDCQWMSVELVYSQGSNQILDRWLMASHLSVGPVNLLYKNDSLVFYNNNTYRHWTPLVVSSDQSSQ